MNSSSPPKFPIPLISSHIVTLPVRDHIGQHIQEVPAVRSKEFGLEFPLIKLDHHRAIQDHLPNEIQKFKPLLLPLKPEELNLDHLTAIQLRKAQEVILLPEFVEAPSLRHQAKILNDYLRSDTTDSLCTYHDLILILKLKNPASFRHQIVAAHHLSHRDGRPTLIHAEADEFLQKLFIQRYISKDSISIHETLDLLLDRFGLAISLDTFRHHLLRNKQLKIVTGVPIDSNRAEIDLKQIKTWYTELNDLLKTVPREFIFNVDESGCDEYVDSKNLSVIVPDEHQSKQVEIPVHRQTKRATLTACISADGSTLKPFVILPRETIDEEIYRAGYTPDKVIFFHHVHSFMTKRIFEQWMNNVFLPEIDSRRTRYNYFGPTILLLDQFTWHIY
jgi:hypothetical protein